LDLVVYYYYFFCEDVQKGGCIYIVVFLFVNSIFEKIFKKRTFIFIIVFLFFLMNGYFSNRIISLSVVVCTRGLCQASKITSSVMILYEMKIIILEKENFFY
jgi:hypothetical protein